MNKGIKEQVNQKYCPCGGIILADTEEWEIPLCYSCFRKYELTPNEKLLLRQIVDTILKTISKKDRRFDGEVIFKFSTVDGIDLQSIDKKLRVSK